jgi:hypothetical protein
LLETIYKYIFFFLFSPSAFVSYTNFYYIYVPFEPQRAKNRSIMKTIIRILFICGTILISAWVIRAQNAIVIDHLCTTLGNVPGSYIDAAKTSLRIFYGHTSHGSQITTGMENLQSHTGQPYTFNWDGSGNALSYQERTDLDLGHSGDTAWATATREVLDASGNDRNVVIWSWCGGVSDNTEEGINIYLSKMTELESQYPGVTFVYMTGHLDIWAYENLKARNQQIRDYCNAQNKILFDFADIESYNPDYTFFDYADDGCNYYSGPGGNLLGNWAVEWCSDHPGSELCWDCSCAHSEPLNCNLKGRAFWWMMARLAGWSGISSTGDPEFPVTDCSFSFSGGKILATLCVREESVIGMTGMNLLGQVIGTVPERSCRPGIYTFPIAVNGCSSGIFLVTLQVNGHHAMTGKVVIP